MYEGLIAYGDSRKSLQSWLHCFTQKIYYFLLLANNIQLTKTNGILLWPCSASRRQKYRPPLELRYFLLQI